MAEINGDFYSDGDPLGPTGRMTAIFGSISDLKTVLTALNNTGFTQEKTAVFVGSAGVESMDFSGTVRNISGLKLFQNAVCDEGNLFDEFERALKSGGAVVAILVDDDVMKKAKLAALLQAHNATKINYWGQWHYEKLA